MTREFSFRSGSFTQVDATEDCYLDPDDPIHALQLASAAGISVESALAQHKLQVEQRAYQERQNSPEMQYAKQYGVRPGTPAWHALFGGKQ